MEKSPVMQRTKLIMVPVMIMVCYTILANVVIFLAYIFYEIAVDSGINTTDNPMDIGTWIAKNYTITSLLGNLFCFSSFSKRWEKLRSSLLDYKVNVNKVNINIATVLLFIGGSIFISYIIESTKINNLLSYDRITNTLQSGNAIGRFFAYVILAPIVEELCFRGIIFNQLLGWKKTRNALIIQAIMFGTIHWNIVQGVYVVLIALALGLLYLRYRKLWLCIVGHIAFNLPSFIMSIFPDFFAHIPIQIYLIASILFMFTGGYLLSKQPIAIPIEHNSINESIL